MTFSPPDRFNLVSYFLEHNLDAGRGDRVAIVARDRNGNESSATFAQVCAQVNRVGNALLDLGVLPEQRVLLALGDGPEFVASWFATVKIGAVVACVNPLLPADDYAYYLEYSRAPVAVVDEDSLPKFAEIVKDARWLRAVIVAAPTSSAAVSGVAWLTGAGGRRVRVTRFSDLVDAHDDRLAPADTLRDEIAVWLFTSGTTGKPKAAVHFHEDFVFNCEHYAKSVMQLAPDDRTMGVPKLFFGYATGSNLLFPFAAGASVALFHERSRPEALFENVARFRPTVLVSVPTAINGMLAVDPAQRGDVSSLRYITSAGEALPRELYQRWMDAFGVEVLDGIGSAEMFHVFISNRLGAVRPGTLGQLVDGYHARVVSPDGTDAPKGEIGTLWIGGGSAALCYWNDRAKSRATFRGDWVVTADQFRIDDDGYFHYSGRADDLLKVGGIWVSPLEIEECMLKHSAVQDVAVIGVEEEGLVKPKAFVVAKDGVNCCAALAAELQEFVKSRLARYKFPRWVEFVPELPRNDRGKCDKKKLRAT